MHGLEIRVFSVIVSWRYNNTKDVMTEIDKLFASLRAFALNRNTITQRCKDAK